MRTCGPIRLYLIGGTLLGVLGARPRCMLPPHPVSRKMMVCGGVAQNEPLSPGFDWLEYNNSYLSHNQERILSYLKYFLLSICLWSCWCHTPQLVLRLPPPSSLGRGVGATNNYISISSHNLISRPALYTASYNEKLRVAGPLMQANIHPFFFPESFVYYRLVLQK